MGNSPSPTPDELRERINLLEQRLAALDAEHEERIAAIEAACRAFAVVFAIPRINPGDDDFAETSTEARG